MAKAREIIKRRKAVRNIKKITKVMQMIATARYQKAYKRAIGTKPYVRKIAELMASVAHSVRMSGQFIEHPLLQEHAEKTNRTVVLVITSNRGLAGGYNGGVLRMAQETIRQVESSGSTPELQVSGKKGIAYFKFLKRPVAQTFTTVGDNPKYTEIEKLAEQYMQDYIKGRIDAVKVVYMRFISAGVQRPGVVDILPLSAIAGEDNQAAHPPGGHDAAPQQAAYEFSPSPQDMLEDLIPRTVKLTLFQAFIEAAVSEQIARMVAMKSATDNADKMAKKLTQDYNRARQSQITSELSELMGGVAALQ